MSMHDNGIQRAQRMNKLKLTESFLKTKGYNVYDRPSKSSNSFMLYAMKGKSRYVFFAGFINKIGGILGHRINKNVSFKINL